MSIEDTPQPVRAWEVLESQAQSHADALKWDEEALASNHKSRTHLELMVAHHRQAIEELTSAAAELRRAVGADPV